MRVGLFVPCYVDQFYPRVAVATLRLLERLSCRVDVPGGQTCCGQPMANAGYADRARGCETHFQNLFGDYEYVVSPSGSCVLHCRAHTSAGKHPEGEGSSRRIYELSEFLTDVLKVERLDARFPHRVGFHASCHGQRGLRLSSMSERNEPSFSKPGYLLSLVEGIEVVYPERADECCGFGGTFCVSEAAVSARMGQDRLREHQANGVEYLTGGDMSCLMHLEGLLRRQKSPVRVLHLAEILTQVSEPLSPLRA